MLVRSVEVLEIPSGVVIELDYFSLSAYSINYVQALDEAQILKILRQCRDKKVSIRIECLDDELNPVAYVVKKNGAIEKYTGIFLFPDNFEVLKDYVSHLENHKYRIAGERKS